MSLWSLDGNLNPDYRSTTATTAATGGGSPSTTNNSTSNKTSSSTLAVNVNHLIFSVCTVLGAALLLL